MASLNIISLPKHIDELRIFMSDQVLDVLAINETSIDSTISDGELKISGYELIRQDRNRNGGGVCFYIHSTTNYKSRASIVPDSSECLCIEIIKPNRKPVIVATWYRPPNSRANILEAFETLVSRIDCENKDIYILGDLNCDMLVDIPTGQTNTLRHICEVYQLSQIITQPRVTIHSNILIDLILTNTADKITFSGVLRVGFSDHDMIYAYRKISFQSNKAHRYIFTRQFKNFSSEKFINDLKNVPWFLLARHADPESMWTEWKTKFLEVADKHAPLRNRRIHNKQSPWITADITLGYNHTSTIAMKYGVI